MLLKSILYDKKVIKEELIVDLRGMTYKQVWEDLPRIVRRPVSTRLAINTLVNKLQRTGSFADEEGPGRPGITPDSLQSVQDAITCSPSASTRRICRELDIPQITVCRILRYKLQKRAYDIQDVQKHEDEDYAARQFVFRVRTC